MLRVRKHAAAKDTLYRLGRSYFILLLSTVSTLRVGSAASYKITAVTQGKVGVHIWDISLAQFFSDENLVVRYLLLYIGSKLTLDKASLFEQFPGLCCLAVRQVILLPPLSAIVLSYQVAALRHLRWSCRQLPILPVHRHRHALRYKSHAWPELGPSFRFPARCRHSLQSTVANLFDESRFGRVYPAGSCGRNIQTTDVDSEEAWSSLHFCDRVRVSSLLEPCTAGAIN